MVKKLIAMSISLLIIGAVFLSACSEKGSVTTTATVASVIGSTNLSTTITQTVTPTSTTTASTTTGTMHAADQPQYGGKCTFVFVNPNSPRYFDPIITSGSGFTASATYDKLISGDWGRGPAGTNEFNFSVPHIPVQYRTGMVAESWEVIDLNTVIWHIRKGIYFQTKPPANGKQLTAADVVYSYTRGLKDPRWTGYGFAEWNDAAGLKTKRDQAKALGKTDAEVDAWITELKSINFPFYAGGYMVATDQWTVKYRHLVASNQIIDIGSFLFVEATEDAKYDMQDYRNACGTGAFCVSDVVLDSSVTWTRNANYWMKDPVHPRNQLPYFDTVTGLVIVEQSTQISALRTHKIDILSVDWDKAITLKQTNPELLQKVQSPAGAIVLFMRTDTAPFNNIKVRQALSMGIDRDKIINDYYRGNAVADAWPVLPGIEGYTPLAQMPPDVRQLYEYQPEIAIQLLADAGYPDGFATEIVIYPGESDEEQLALVAEQMKSINIAVTIRVVEAGIHSALIYKHTYPQMIYSWWGNPSPSSVMGWAHGGVSTSMFAFSNPVDPLAQTAFSQWSAMIDPIARHKFLQAEYLREDLLAWEIPLVTRTGSTVWAPYLKGYHGEVSMGLTFDMGSSEITKFLWVDPKMKASTVK